MDIRILSISSNLLKKIFLLHEINLLNGENGVGARSGLEENFYGLLQELLMLYGVGILSTVIVAYT